MDRNLLYAIGIVVLAVVSIINFPQPNTQEIVNTTQSPITSSTVTINLPAVDEQGNGVVARLKVQTLSGEGRILTNINQLFFWVDTQYSIRTAEEVARNLTGKDLSKTDLIYTIETNASIIEGQSAGAGLTIATIAAIENKQLNPNVMITGTINPDGTIGPVGSILAKAKASKDVGTKLFLVPLGQGVQTNYLPEQHCEQSAQFTFCTTEYKSQKVNISKDAGIEIREVSTINDAIKYLIKD